MKRLSTLTLALCLTGLASAPLERDARADGTGDFKVSNFAIGFENNNWWWRGYAFTVSRETVVTHMFGGGGPNCSSGFQGGIFTASWNGGTPGQGTVRIDSLLRGVVFDPNRDPGNPPTEQTVALSSPLTLQPGQFYFIGQGRSGATGEGCHYAANSIDVQNLLIGSPIIESWYPNSDAAFQIGGPFTAESIVSESTLSNLTPVRVLVGFRYLTDVDPPGLSPDAGTGDALSVSPTSAVVNGLLNDSGAATDFDETTLYFEVSTNPNLTGSSTFLIPAQPFTVTGPATDVPFAATLTGLSGGTTYYYRAVAINEAARSNGAIRNFTHDSQNFARSVTATAGANGSVTPATRAVLPGDTATFAALPAPGFQRVLAVGGTCSTDGASWSGNNYTTGVITDDCTVSFTFEAITYTIGGSVGGLIDGTSFVLQANGHDPLEITEDGPFTLPGGYNIGDNYEVLVVQQPAGPSQSCSIQNATGVVGEGNVTSLVVSCVLNTSLVMSDDAAAYDQTREPVLVDPELRVFSPVDIDGALVSFGSGFVPAEDRLSFTEMHGITGSYNTSTGVLSLEGNASAEQYEELLRTVTYDNVATGDATGGPRVVQISLGAAGLYFEPNGHFYEFVLADGISWTAARDAASQRFYYGLQGYLTTVTSAEENGFIASRLAGQGWMGASDAASEGIWRWVTGPEGLEDGGQGRHFFTQPVGGTGGVAVGGFYHNWASGEPNDFGTGEDYAHFLTNGQWNDYPLSLPSISGYVVEYGGMPNDPVVEVADSRVVNVFSCGDGQVNGNETGVDCGGPSCGPCGTGGGCEGADDCLSLVCEGGSCQAATCTDGVQNQDETDVDCGGPNCDGCGAGGACAGVGDCESLVCTGEVCQEATCSDSVRNGLETGVDCGGPDCAPCGDGGGCAVGGDCQSLVCEGEICQEASCQDGVQNALETGVDCGGPDCAPCAPGGGCTGPGDCASEVCLNNTCQAPTCTDGVQNGAETDVDCGGTCGPCGDGGGCAVGGDCGSGVCDAGSCQEASCQDGVRNGLETGVDCGGPDCAPCAPGGGCGGAGDCVSGVCLNNTCQAPTCTDNVQNGDETDVDCGGSCGPCGDGGDCGVASDCGSGVCESGTCQSPSCVDGVRNGLETGVDCGGPDCAECAPGGGCASPGDCQSGVCTNHVCQAPTCTDAVQNGDETDVDCGGSCGPCADGADCAVASDCGSGVCASGTCQGASCQDGVRNGLETGVDCGGPDCGPCGAGVGCGLGSDCVSGVCLGGLCQLPSCADGVRNGDETDVDCGGSCGPCADDGACAVAGDCVSGVCVADVCQAPTCEDSARNGLETGVDCGGPDCAPCAPGGGCLETSDCSSGVCANNTCQLPTCFDGVQNADETGVDCGGACGPCADGVGCGVAADCQSGVCDGETCQIPTCSDGVQNGDETGVDCGGSCGPCAPGVGCAEASDCTSGVCINSTCQLPSCNDNVQNGDETALDCGGSCGPCADGESCGVAADCASGVCIGEVCQIPNCEDGVHNGDETDVDCGGSCGPCAPGDGCAVAGDCTTGVCANNTCQLPACTDNVQNGAETGVDCGGPTCAPCADGIPCLVASDCQSGVCDDETSLCLEGTCSDGVQNGDETGVDCGGSCGPCFPGDGCAEASDCTSGVCMNNTCQLPSCADGVLNGDETDVDCGGSCAPCADGGACLEAPDCASGVCDPELGQCLAPTCEDGVRNGDETDVDCGGSCGPCEDGAGCLVSDDCTSEVCSVVTGTCLEASCRDGVQNGDETDVDCGGSCDPCDDGGGCLIADDCASGVCDAETNLCLAPTCEDGVRNGDETDVDCGGSCGPCDTGEACSVAADCVSLVCGPNGQCFEATCEDGVQNGDETDVDCGGETCGPCVAGDSCVVALDCESFVCDPDSETCLAATCEDGVRNQDETDVDCGGDVCGACADGDACAVASDCVSLVCDPEEGLCLAATCDDGVQNADETDVDCGGAACGPCADGAGCLSASDCVSLVCDGEGLCLAATCEDGVQNADETAVDCGGSCEPCDAGDGCAVASDCVSLVCGNDGLCLAATCDDGVRNQGEADIDCAGPCALCEAGANCGDNGDCASDICDEGMCVDFSLDGPSDGDITSDTRPTFFGTATPGTTVTLSIGGETFEVVADAEGQWSWTPESDYEDGLLVAVVSVGDAYSETVSITIDSQAPVLTIDPRDEEEEGAILRGSGEPGLTVVVQVNGEVVGEVEVDDNGRWSLDIEAHLVEGDNAIVATSTDAAGNEARASTDFPWSTAVTETVYVGGGGCQSGGEAPWAGLLLLLGAIAWLRRRDAQRS